MNASCLGSATFGRSALLCLSLLAAVGCAGQVDDTSRDGNGNAAVQSSGGEGEAGRAGAPSQGGSGGSGGGVAGADQGAGGGGTAKAGAGGETSQPTETSCAAPTAVDFTGAPGGAQQPQPCACTRRPGSGTSWQCPIGVGQSASATIGPKGGTVSLYGQQGAGSGVAFELVIPPTALDHDVKITIVETSEAPLGSFVDFSPVYRIEPTDLTFAVPVKVRIPWGNSLTQVSNALSIYWAGGCGGTFERVPDSYVNAGFNQASTKQLGWAIVGYEKGPSLEACP